MYGCNIVKNLLNIEKNGSSFFSEVSCLNYAIQDADKLKGSRVLVYPNYPGRIFEVRAMLSLLSNEPSNSLLIVLKSETRYDLLGIVGFFPVLGS